MSNELKIAIEAAEKGAQEALKYFDKPLDIVFKDDMTPVTIADKKSEEIIRDYLSHHFPGSQFVGEEGGGSKNVDDFWTIDPVDGTRSFSRGVPGWCVLLSHYKNGQFRIGVCYFPVFKQLLYAERGGGAFMNKKQVYVSKVSTLSKAYTAFGNPRYIENKKVINQLVEKSASVRSWEATYSQFLIAQGKCDALIEGYGQTWDVAPFVSIIEEAGGKITKLDGTPVDLKSRGCISTNGVLHDEVVKLYKSTLS